MKRILLLLLVLAMLAGCKEHTPPETVPVENTQPTTVVTQPVVTEPVDRNDPVEKLTNGAVRSYPLSSGQYVGIQPMGDDMLLFSCSDEAADEMQLTRVDGQTGEFLKTVMLEGTPEVGTAALRVTETSVVYYSRGTVHFLNGELQEIRRIALPEEAMGTPAITADMNHIYYCVSQGIRAMDLQTGISRLVKEYDCRWHSLVTLAFDDQLLVCSVVDVDADAYIAFVSAQTGETLVQDANVLEFSSLGDTYCCLRSDGSLEQLLIGSRLTEAQVLLPGDDDAAAYPLLEMNSVITVSEELESSAWVEQYDLISGRCTASVFLEGIRPYCVAAENGYVWMLGKSGEQDALYRWDTAKSPVDMETVYISPMYTRENPDAEGIEACQQRADRIAAKYGVEINLTPERMVQPENYRLTDEYQVQALENGLEQLESVLKQFPEGMLTEMMNKSDDGILHINLVRRIGAIQGGEESWDGLQYWVDGKSYVAVTICDTMEQIAYHELFHAMETYIFSNSFMLDTWSDCNPKKFDYDYNYEDYLTREDTQYLEGEDRAFIDSYSMSYPKEDRARFFAYAMMEDTADYFTSETMQKKLKKMCEAIRDAFEWTEEEGEYPWEQYLEESLAYVKKKK